METALNILTQGHQRMTNKRSVFKFIFKTLLIVIGILIVIPIGLFFIVEPNDFKPQIQSYLTEKSGYPIQLNGDIHLKLFPWVGLSVKEIVIPSPNRQDKQPLFSAKAFNLKMPLDALLKRELRLDSLSIDEGHFYLVKEKNGTTNWQVSSIKDSNSLSTKTAQSSLDKARPIYFSISVLTLKKGDITYLDKQKNQAFYFKQVTFEGETLNSSHTSPLKGQFDFIVNELSNNRPLYTGHATLKTHIPNWDAKEYHFDKINTTLDWKDLGSQQSHHLEASLNLRIIPDKSIEIKELNADLDRTTLQGKITIPLTQHPISYDLSLNEINLSSWLKQTSHNSAEIKPASYQLTAATPTTFTIPHSKGILRIQHLIYEQTHAYNVVLNSTTTADTLVVSPITADLFDGKLKASLNAPFKVGSPIHISGNLTQANMQTLLQNLANVDQLTGKGNLNFNFTKSPQNLSGSTKVEMTHGSIQGLDLDYYQQMAENFIKKQTTRPPHNNAATTFSSLTATFMLNYPMINNEDLIMVSPRYQTTGRGAINLARETIDYDVTIYKTSEEGKVKPSTLPLAVSIKGPLSQPQVVPNLDVYLKKILEQEGKKHLEKLFGNPKDSNKGTENKLEEKIEKEIEKGLKKLFKF